jgi:hypothetical protein
VYDGVEYNLIQEAAVIKAPDSFGLGSDDSVFVGAFTRGDDPTKPSGSTAICVSKISVIKQDILEAKKKHALSCDNQDTADRYLPNLKSSSECITEKVLSSFFYDIHKIFLKMFLL